MAAEKQFENRLKKFLEDEGCWKPITGYEHRYEVSDKGFIRNVKTGKMKVPQLMKNGYFQVLFWTKHKGKGCLVHRLVAEAFLPNPLNLSDVNHKDGNKQNNSVDNLEWCSRSHNIKHAYENHLRHPSNQKLTLDQVRYIKDNPCGFTRHELAQMFGVTYWCICNIYQGKSHKGVS